MSDTELNSKRSCLKNRKSMLRTFCLSALLALAVSFNFFPNTTQAQQSTSQNGAGSKTRLAVMELETSGTKEATAAAVSEKIRSDIFATGQFILVDRAQINKILDEKAFQQALCTDGDCDVKVGSILKVEKIVTGRLAHPQPEIWQVTLQMTDVESTEIQALRSLAHNGDVSSLLNNAVPTVVSGLLGQGATTNGGGTGGSIAFFPPYYSGKGKEIQQRRENELLEKILPKAETVLNLQFNYGYFPGSKNLPQGGRPRMELDTWSSGSLFSGPSLNTAFVMERARNQKSDWAFTYHTDSSRNSVEVFLLDVRQGKEYRKSVSYDKGTFGRSIVHTVVKLMKKALTE